MENKRYLMAQKKREAFFMFTVKGMSKKEISKIIGVSEKSLVNWGKKHKWNNSLPLEIKVEGGISELMKRFFDYVEIVNPGVVDNYKELWTAFLKSEEKKLKL